MLGQSGLPIFRSFETVYEAASAARFFLAAIFCLAM